MPEETESLETLSVSIEADISKLLAGARAGVEQADEILTEIATPTLDVNTLPLLGKITEVINRYTELSLTVEQVIGAINAGAESGASAVEQLAGSMLEYSVIQQQSMAMTKRDFADMGTATAEETQNAIQHLVQLGDQYNATQQEVIAFAKRIDSAREALHRMGMGEAEAEIQTVTESTQGMVSVFYELTQMLHARPAAMFVSSLKKIDAEVTLVKDGVETLGTNILGVLQLAAEAGDVVEVRVDAENAIETLRLVDEAMVKAEVAIGRIPPLTEEAATGFQAIGSASETVAPLIGEVVAGFRELGELPFAQQVAVINQGLGENATKVQELTGLLLEYAQVQTRTAEAAALALWEEGVLNTQELSEALGLLQSLSSEFSANAQEVEAFKAQLSEAHATLTEMWEPVDKAAPSWMDQAGQMAQLGESAQMTDRLVQQMNENTQVGLETNIDLFEKLIYSQGELSAVPWDEMSDGLERIFEGLNKVTLSQEQASAAVAAGSQEGSSAIQQVVGNVVQLSQIIGQPFQDITELLLEMGVISIETADGVVASLNKIASTSATVAPLIGEVLASFRELGELPLPQQIAAINQGLDKNATKVQELTALLLEYAQVQMSATEHAAMDLWERGVLNVGELSEVVGLLQSLGNEFSANTQEVAAFEAQLLEVHETLAVMWEPTFAEPLVMEDLTGPMIELGESVQRTDQLTQQMHENTREGLGTNIALLEWFIRMQGAQSLGPWNEMKEGLDQVGEGLKGITLSGEQATAAVASGAERGASEIQRVTANVIQLSQIVEHPFERVAQLLLATGRISVETADQVVVSLQRIAQAGVSAGVSIGEVVAGFQEFERLKTGQVITIIKQGLEDSATAGQKFLGSLVELAQIQMKGLGPLVAEQWVAGLYTAGEAAEGLDALVQAVGADFGVTTQEVEAFNQQIEAAWEGIEKIWDAFDRSGQVLDVVAGEFKTVEESVQVTDQLLQQMAENTRAGLEGNLTLLKEFVYVQGEQAPVPVKTMDVGLQSIKEGLEGITLSGEQATAAIAAGAQQSSSAVQQVVGNITQLSQVVGQPFERIAQLLTSTGMISVETANKVVASLRKIATTEVNESPLSASLRSIQELLDGITRRAQQVTTSIGGMDQATPSVDNVAQSLQRVAKWGPEIRRLRADVVELFTPPEAKESPLSVGLKSLQNLLEGVAAQARKAIEAVTGLGRQVPTQRLTMVGIIPEPSLIQKAGQLITRVYNQIRTAGAAMVERLTQSFGSLRVAENAAATGASNLSAIIQRGMQDGAAMVDQLAAFVGRLAQENDLAVGEVVAGLVDSRQITKQVGSDIMGVFEGTKKGAGGLGKALSGLGGIAKSVFGVAFGLTAIQALRKVIALMKEVAKETIAFQTNLVRLDIAVRAAQRVQGDAIGTIAGWRDHVQELGDEFENLSQVQLVEGAAQTVLLTRELKLNEDQMMRVYRAAATLASLHDIKMRPALTLVVQGLTGIGRGLRRYGVFLSRAQLNQEALSMGLKDNWTDLNSNERALVALNVIMRQVEPIVEDLGHLYGTLGGRVQVATGEIKDARTELGRISAPLVVMWKESLAAVLTFVGTAVKALSHLVAIVVATGYAIHVFTETLKETGNAALAALAAQEAWGKGLVSVSEDLGLLGPILKDVGDDFIDFGDVGEEELEELLKTLEKFGDRFEKALLDYQRSLADAAEDLEEKLVDLQRDYERDLEEALQDLIEAMEDLERQYVRKRADIIQNAQDKLDRLEQEGGEKRAKLLRDHLVKMRRMWEDHQIKLRRMREDFEETMREAVSKRDAWGAVQAIRAFTKDRRRAIEDYGLRRSRAEEDFTRRLGDLDGQNEAERRKIIEARERALADLEIWLARRREEIDEDYAEDLEDLKIENARQEEEIRRSYAQRLEDIELGLVRKLAAIAEAMADEKDVTAAGAKAVFEELFKVFGFGGDIDQLMDAFETRLARNIKIRVAVERAMLGGSPETGQIPGMQRGGTIIANKPTLARFGEAGPEMATFIPLNQWSRMATAAHHAGTLKIEVSADEHFSSDFEELVARQLSQFVRRVVA